MSAYYNENDRFAAAWLRELIREGLIADGEVDERSIADVAADDVRGFTQCHFFAGIGGWSYALRLAGWPDNRAVWTGSCPCQPFSSAGKGHGKADTRHLWPEWFRLIAECRPVVCFGEQVESAIEHGWIDGVCDDMEREGYAIGAAILPAASIGAFHVRQRLWFVADRDCRRCEVCSKCDSQQAPYSADWCSCRPNACRCRGISELADAARTNQWRHRGESRSASSARDCEAWSKDGNAARSASELGDTDDTRSQGWIVGWNRADQCAPWAPSVVEWINCRDGKRRPVEPGTFPLAHGIPARVGRLRGYGNAIVPQVAAEFIRAYINARAGEVKAG